MVTALRHATAPNGPRPASHGVRHEGSRFGGKRFGEGLGVPYAPYQIPYGTLAPRDVRNLLAPVPVSATHVGFCALRLEPIWTSLGQAAGHAAHLVLAAGEKGESDRIRGQPIDCDRCKSATKRYALGVSHGESLDDLEHNGPFIGSLTEQEVVTSNF
jgi:hypothetical protein